MRTLHHGLAAAFGGESDLDWSAVCTRLWVAAACAIDKERVLVSIMTDEDVQDWSASGTRVEWDYSDGDGLVSRVCRSRGFGRKIGCGVCVS